MENSKLFVAVKACIVNSNNEVLLLRESSDYQGGTNIEKYDIPGGRIDVSESLLNALTREVFEETGLYVRTSELLDAHDTFNTKGNEVWHIVRLFYRVVCDNGEIILSKDHDMFEWVLLSSIDKRMDIIGNLLPIFKKLNESQEK